MKVLAVANNDPSGSSKKGEFDAKRMKLPVHNAVGSNTGSAIKSAAAVITNNGDHWTGEHNQLREGIQRSGPALTMNGFSPSAALSTAMKDMVTNEVVGLAVGHGVVSVGLAAVTASAVPLLNGISGGYCHSSLNQLCADNTAVSTQCETFLNAVATQPLTSTMPLSTIAANTSASDDFASSVMAMPVNSFASASREFESSITTLESCMLSLNAMSSDVAFVVGERTAAAATKIHDTLHRKLCAIYRQQNASRSNSAGRSRSRSGPQQSRLHADVEASELDAGLSERKLSLDQTTLPKLESKAGNIEAEVTPTADTAVSKFHSVKFDWNLVEELRFRSSIAERGVRTVQHAIDEYATDSSSAASSDDEEVEHGRAVSFDDNKWCGVPIKRRSLYRYAAERARLMRQMKYCDLRTNQLQNWFRQLIILRHMHKQGENSPIDPFHLVSLGGHSSEVQQHQHRSNADAVQANNSTAKLPQLINRTQANKLPSQSADTHLTESTTSTRSGSPRRSSIQAVDSFTRSTRPPTIHRDLWWSDFKQNDDKMLVELQAELTAIDRRDNNVPENNNILPLRSFLSPLVASSTANSIKNADTDDDENENDVLPPILPPGGFAELSFRLLANSNSSKSVEPAEKLPVDVAVANFDHPPATTHPARSIAPPSTQHSLPAISAILAVAAEKNSINSNQPHSTRLKPIRWRPDLIDARRRQQSLFINSACNVVTVSTGNGGKHAGVTSETQEPVSWMALARASGLQLAAIAREAQVYLNRHPQFRHLSKVMFNDEQLRQLQLPNVLSSSVDAVRIAADTHSVRSKSAEVITAVDAAATSESVTPSASLVAKELTPPIVGQDGAAVAAAGDDAVVDDSYSLFELPARCRPVQHYFTTKQRPKLFLLNEQVSLGTNCIYDSNPDKLSIPQTIVPAFVRPYRLPSSYRYKELNKALSLSSDSHNSLLDSGSTGQNVALNHNSNNMLVNALNRHRGADQQLIQQHQQHVSFAVDTYPHVVDENCWSAVYRSCRGSADFRSDNDFSGTATWNQVPTSERGAFVSVSSSPFDDDTLGHPALYDDTRQSWLASALQQLNPLVARSKATLESNTVVPANDSYEDQALLPHRAFFGAGLGEQRRDAVRREQLIERARFLVFQTVQKAHRDRIKYQNLMHADGARKGKDLSRLRAHLRHILRQEQQQQQSIDEHTDDLNACRSAAERFVVDAQRKLIIQKRRQLLYRQRKLQLQQQQHQQPEQHAGSAKKSRKRRRATTSSEDEEQEEHDEDEDDYEDAVGGSSKRQRRRRHRSSSKHSRSMHSRTQSGSLDGGDVISSSNEETDDTDDDKRRAGGSDEEDESVEASNENLFLLGTIPHHPSHLPAGARARASASSGRPRASAGKKHVLEYHGKSSTMAKGGRKKSFGTAGGANTGGLAGNRSTAAGGAGAAVDEVAASTFGDTYVVPFGHFGPPRVERLDYKEIKTPQWRRVDVDVLVTNSSSTTNETESVAVHLTQEVCDANAAAGAHQPEIGTFSESMSTAPPFVSKDADAGVDDDDSNRPVEVYAPAPRPHALCQSVEEILNEMLSNQDSSSSSSNLPTSGSTSSQDELLRALESVLLADSKSSPASPNPSAPFLPPYNPASSNNYKQPSSIVVVIKKKQQVLMDRMLMPPPPTPPRSLVLTSTASYAAGLTPVDNSRSVCDSQQSQDLDESTATSVTPPDLNLHTDSSGGILPDSPLTSSLDTGGEPSADAAADGEVLLDSAYEGRHASCEQEERQKIMEYLKNLETRKRSRQALDATLKAATTALPSQTSVDLPSTGDISMQNNGGGDNRQPGSENNDAGVDEQQQQQQQPQDDIYEQQTYENFVYDIGFEPRRFPLTTTDNTETNSPASGDSESVPNSNGRSMRYTIRRRVSIPKQSQHSSQGSDSFSAAPSRSSPNKPIITSSAAALPQSGSELQVDQQQRQHGVGSSGRSNNKSGTQRSVGGNFALLKAHGRAHAADENSMDYAVDAVDSSLMPFGLDTGGGTAQQHFDEVGENQPRFDADYQGTFSQPSIAWSSSSFSQDSTQSSVNSHLLARLTGAVKAPKTRRSKAQLQQQQPLLMLDHHYKKIHDDCDFDEPTTPPGSPPPELIKRLSVSRASEENSNGSSGAGDDVNTQPNDTATAQLADFVVKREQEPLFDGELTQPFSSNTTSTDTVVENCVNTSELPVPAGDSSDQNSFQQSQEDLVNSYNDDEQRLLQKKPFVRSNSRSMRRSSQTSLDAENVDQAVVNHIAVKAEQENCLLQSSCDQVQLLDGTGKKSLPLADPHPATRRLTRRQTAAAGGSGNQQ